MFVYRLKEALAAVARDERRIRIVTLDVGTIVRTRRTGPALPKTGLVDVTVDGVDLAMFMQDLQTRAELVDKSPAIVSPSEQEARAENGYQASNNSPTEDTL